MKKLTRLFTAVLSIVSSMVVTGNVFGNIATRRTMPTPQSQQANQTVSIDQKSGLTKVKFRNMKEGLLLFKAETLFGDLQEAEEFQLKN